MSSSERKREVKKEDAFVPPVRVKQNIALGAIAARTKPKPNVFRVGYLGTHADVDSVHHFGLILKQYASIMKSTEKIDYVEVITLDEMPVRMNDPPEVKEDDEESKNEFVAEWIKMPKYMTPGIGLHGKFLDSRSVEEHERYKEFRDLDKETQNEFTRRFNEQYLLSSNIDLWIAGVTTIKRGVYWTRNMTSTLDLLANQAVFRPKRLLVIANSSDQVESLEDPIPESVDINAPVRYWDPVRYGKVTSNGDIIEWLPDSGDFARVVLKVNGTEEHIKATLDWMFSLHKGAVTKAISKGTQERLPQTIEDLVASYSLSTSGKYYHSKKWLKPSSSTAGRE
jgi:hypothetical protein